MTLKGPYTVAAATLIVTAHPPPAGFHMAQLLPVNDTSVYMGHRPGTAHWDSYPYCSLSVGSFVSSILRAFLASLPFVKAPLNLGL